MSRLLFPASWFLRPHSPPAAGPAQAPLTVPVAMPERFSGCRGEADGVRGDLEARVEREEPQRRQFGAERIGRRQVPEVGAPQWPARRELGDLRPLRQEAQTLPRAL